MSLSWCEAYSLFEKEPRALQGYSCCEKIPQPHTADRVLDVMKAVLCEWSIEESRISKVLTDNGSNVVAAF